ncbi:hypothetical protein TNCV_820421 [Trichonephila clavipes]|nr:hypothetical protein TNCV_820421 [Trichonephila clavipes]
MSQGSNSSPFDLGNSPPSSGELDGSQSVVQLLLRNFHGSKIRLNSRTQYHCRGLKRFPEVKSPQFGIRLNSRTQYSLINR